VSLHKPRNNQLMNYKGQSPSSETKSVSQSRNSPPFMEHEVSLLCLQDPTTSTYLEPDESILYPQILVKIHFNIIFPSMHKSPNWSLPFRFPNQNFVCTSHFSHMYHIPHSSHPLGFHDSENILLRVHIMELLIMLTMQL
jgi:hypothetical protein